MRKVISIFVLLSLALTSLAGCTGSNTSEFDTSKPIGVVSREDGSGTRGAFVELFGIEVKGDDGSKKDMTTKDAIIANQTNVMMTNVAGDKYAIGYISLGSLGETVKAVQIEGVSASAENVKNGTYPISRPFNITTKGMPTGIVKDFIDFILSAEGQAVASQNYIAVNDSSAAYASSKPSGKIVVAGSSSVSPLMEKLIEAYKTVNPGAEIELQTNDSSTGMTAAIDGTCDIGMASRELKDSELAELTAIQIALDGLAVIVNKENPVANLTKEQVKLIFTGEALAWSDMSQ